MCLYSEDQMDFFLEADTSIYVEVHMIWLAVERRDTILFFFLVVAYDLCNSACIEVNTGRTHIERGGGTSNRNIHIEYLRMLVNGLLVMIVPLYADVLIVFFS